MYNKRYKKLQHKINRAIRNLNKNIANDNLWRGRFYAQQKRIWFKTYEDKSGVTAIVEIILADKETGVIYCVFLRGNEIIGLGWDWNKFSKGCGWQLWREMNDFICKATKGLNFREYKETAIDYTNDKRWSK